jgi:hypothetical protein
MARNHADKKELMRALVQCADRHYPRDLDTFNTTRRDLTVQNGSEITIKKLLKTYGQDVPGIGLTTFHYTRTETLRHNTTYNSTNPPR